MLGQGAFAGCERLRVARLNEGLEVLGTEEVKPGVFEDSGLESVVLPASLRVIRSRAFAGCSGLSSLQLPAGLESVGADCFRGTGLDAEGLLAAVQVGKRLAQNVGQEEVSG